MKESVERKMSTESIGEKEGWGTVIQDYLINAGETQGEIASHPMV